MNKSLVLNRIKEHYGFKSDAEFARFLDITPQNLSNWYTRNTFDVERIYTKCEEINPEWLLSGKGNMLKEAQDTTTPTPETQSEESSQELLEAKNKIIALQEEKIKLMEKLQTIDDTPAIRKLLKNKEEIKELEKKLKEVLGNQKVIMQALGNLLLDESERKLKKEKESEKTQRI